MRARTAKPNSGSTASRRGARRRTTRRASALRSSGPKCSLVSETHAPDEVYERVRAQFSEDELAHLTLAIVSINGWNRLNIAARTVPGDYVPGRLATSHAASGSHA